MGRGLQGKSLPVSVIADDTLSCSSMNTSRRKLREMLSRPGIIHSLGVHDVFSACVAEAAGLEFAFLGGFGVSASLLGLPDLGLLTQTEMADAIRRVTSRTSIPVVADGDTGHGELHNVRRTVQQFERAGAAGILIEDQVSQKRCGHFAGKQVVSADEMLTRLNAALEAREDPDFVVFARTDALATHGIDEAIARANRYGDAGADVCFVESPATRDDLVRIGREVRYPQLANMLTGGKTPILSARELEQLGFKIVVCPVSTLMISGRAIQRLVAELKSEGRVDTLAEEMISFDEVKQILGVDELLRPAE